MPDLAEGLVLVAALPHVLGVDHVVGRLLRVVPSVGQFGRESLEVGQGKGGGGEKEEISVSRDNRRNPVHTCSAHAHASPGWPGQGSTGKRAVTVMGARPQTPLSLGRGLVTQSCCSTGWKGIKSGGRCLATRAQG